MASATSLNDVEHVLDNYIDQYNDLVKTVNKRHTNITRWATGTAIAVGGLSAYGISHYNLDGPLSDWFNNRLGLNHVIPVAQATGPNVSHLGGGTTGDVPHSGLGDAVPHDTLGNLDVPNPPFIEMSHTGDSIWTTAERQVEAHYPNLDAVHRTFVVDAIKDRVLADKAQFGLGNVADVEHGLPVGQRIDYSSIFGNNNEIQGILNQANALTHAEIQNILNNINNNG